MRECMDARFMYYRSDNSRMNGYAWCCTNPEFLDPNRGDDFGVELTTYEVKVSHYEEIYMEETWEEETIIITGGDTTPKPKPKPHEIKFKYPEH